MLMRAAFSHWCVQRSHTGVDASSAGARLTRSHEQGAVPSGVALPAETEHGARRKKPAESRLQPGLAAPQSSGELCGSEEQQVQTKCHSHRFRRLRSHRPVNGMQHVADGRSVEIGHSSHAAPVDEPES
jgi:hypothetical protein